MPGWKSTPMKLMELPEKILRRPMYAVPELHGQSPGKRLMEKALEWLDVEGDIRLEVVSYNLKAINFYKKYGFQEISLPVSDKRTQLPSGKQIPRIVMVRRND